jgi:hypothetical protein
MGLEKRRPKSMMYRFLLDLVGTAANNKMRYRDKNPPRRPDLFRQKRPLFVVPSLISKFCPRTVEAGRARDFCQARSGFLFVCS